MKLDYHALLTIYGWPSLSAKTRRSIVAWLQRTAKELQKEDPKIFNHKRFRARHMK